MAAALAALNACLLVAFVRPLYAPVTPPEYVSLVTQYSARRQLARAADIYASALKSYPDSPELKDLGDASPRLLLGGQDEMFGLLQRHLARGGGLRNRDALLALASRLRLRDSKALNVEALNQAIADAQRDPELAEAAALVTSRRTSRRESILMPSRP